MNKKKVFSKKVRLNNCKQTTTLKRVGRILKVSKALKIQQVITKVGLSRSYIWKLEQANKFPKHFKVGLRAIRWLETDIDTWLEERKAESNPK